MKIVIYGKYNFLLIFTSSLLSMLKSSGIVNKAAKFIRENKMILLIWR